MKKICLLLLCTVFLALGACSSKDTATTNGDESKADETKQTVTEGTENSAVKKKEEDTGTPEQEETANNEDAYEPAENFLTEAEKKEGFKYRDDFGGTRDYGFGYNDEVGIDGTDNPLKPVKFGPVNMTIENVTVADIIPNSDVASFFDNRDRVRAVIMTVKIENTSEQDVSFFPDSSVMTTDTGEQVDADSWMSNETGGDMLGKVKKEGQIWYVLKNEKADIKKVKFVIDPPYLTDSMDDLGQQKRLEFDILDPKAAKKKDNQ